MSLWRIGGAVQNTIKQYNGGLGCGQYFKRNFNVSQVLSKKKKEKCPSKKQLPCQKVDPIAKAKEPKLKGCQACDKTCMPCCGKARDPPQCVFPFVKPKCKKIKPPRPAFSECDKRPLQPIMPCECDPPRAEPCKKK